MARINMSSVMGKVKAFAKSKDGQERINRAVSDLRAKGGAVTEAGDTVITHDSMIRAAELLISILRETASQKGLPESVRKHFDSLYHTDPAPYGKESSRYKCDIIFGDDLSRMSLLITTGPNKGKRTGEGISDIVSLFDTGYDADKRVYGLWDGHGKDTVASRTHREGLHFMSEAIDSFNREYGAVYNARAYMTSDEGRFSSD